jgi:hypothetical protein
VITARPISITTDQPIVILFTGSRFWTDHLTIGATIDEIVTKAVAAGVPELTFRHGACYPPRDPDTGRRPARSADFLVHIWIARFGGQQPIPIVEQERPAKWTAPCRPSCHQKRRRNQPASHRQLRGGRLICPAAGVYRNREMVLENPEPYLGVAFQQDNSNGTQNCIDTMLELSVPVHPFAPQPVR